MPHALILAAAAALSLSAVPAIADTQASATLSDIEVRLVDLDLADGIAPSITFADGVDSGASATARSLTYPPRSGQSNPSGDGPFGAVSAAAGATATGAASALAGDVFSATGFMQATAFSGLAALGKAVGSVCVGGGGCEPQFTLSPETALYVTGIGDISAAAGDQDYAYAIIILAIDESLATHVSGGFMEVDAGKLDSPPVLTHSTAPMQAQLINDSAAPFLGTLTIDVYASADSQLEAPVSTAPEPASGALVGLGCLVLAAASRRRGRTMRPAVQS